MAISFVGSAGGSATNGNDVTLTLPSMQQGDLVIVAYAIGDNDGVNFTMAMVTAGYTNVADLFADDTQDCNLGVFWKVMGATPDTTAVVDGQGGADAAVAAVAMVFRGVDTGTPMDVTPTTATGINTMHPNPPSIDHLNPAGLWTVIAGASGHTLLGAGTYTFPTGYTTNALDRGSDDTSDVTVGMGYRTNPADPEDPGVMTHSGTDSANFAWCAATIALRPLTSQTFFKTLAATEVSVATLVRVSTFRKTLAGTELSVVALARKQFRALAATAVSVLTLTKALKFLKTLSATELSTATLTRVLKFAKTLGAVEASAVTLTKIATFRRTLVVTVVSVLALVRKQFRTLSATAVSVTTLTKALKYLKALAATAASVPTLTRVLKYARTLAASTAGAAQAAAKDVIVVIDRVLGTRLAKRLTDTVYKDLGE